MEVGQAVIQHGSKKPVPVDLKYVDVDKQVSDQQLKQHQKKKWDNLDWTTRQDVEIDFDNPEPSKDKDFGDYL